MSQGGRLTVSVGSCRPRKLTDLNARIVRPITTGSASTFRPLGMAQQLSRPLDGHRHALP